MTKILNGVSSRNPHRPTDDEVRAAVADLAEKVQSALDQLPISPAASERVVSLLIAELRADMKTSRDQLALRLES